MAVAFFLDTNISVRVGGLDQHDRLRVAVEYRLWKFHGHVIWPRDHKDEYFKSKFIKWSLAFKLSNGVWIVKIIIFFYGTTSKKIKEHRRKRQNQQQRVNHRRDLNPQSPAHSLELSYVEIYRLRRPMPYPLGHGGWLKDLVDLLESSVLNVGSHD